MCGGAGTRYQAYSCVHGFGHAFMRIYGDRARRRRSRLCRALGPRAAPDCAQGAYHDYWFAVAGSDEASTARRARSATRACSAAPSRREFVRPCWYRALVENRPEGLVVDSPRAPRRALLAPRRAPAGGVRHRRGRDRAGRTRQQLALCAGLAGQRDAVACVRGTKVQNLLGAPTAALRAPRRPLRRVRRRARAACYRWLGKAVAVLTDGAFARDGLPAAATARPPAATARRARARSTTRS